MNHLRSVFGIVFVLIMIAGFTSLSFAEYASPRIQLESGVLPEDIMCRNNFVLVIRENGNPACVTERTAEKMGWNTIPRNVNEEIIISEIQKSIVSVPLSDERIVTDSTFDIMTSSGSSMIGITGCPPFWPIYTIDTPSQVAIGEEFEIIVDYSYAIPDIDAGYEDPDEIFEPEKYLDVCLFSAIEIRTASFVHIIDEQYVETWNSKRWHISPPELRTEGIIPYEFDNTGPQQKIIKMRIDQPRFGDQLAEISIKPGYTFDAHLVIVTHDGIVDFVETTIPRTSLEMTQRQLNLENIRSDFEIPAPIKITNQTYNLENALVYYKEPTFPTTSANRDVHGKSSSEDYANWLMQSRDVERRMIKLIHITEYYGQAYANAVLAARPEITTQEKKDEIDFPRHMDELVSMLSSKPNGFAEIYLSQVTFSPETIERLSLTSNSNQINSESTHENIKKFIFDSNPQLQTSTENRVIVDKFLDFYPALELQNFFFNQYYTY